MTSGMAIKLKRISLGIKQKELASILGISPQYLSQLENGFAKNPSLDIVRGLNKVLGISIESLIFTEQSNEVGGDFVC